MSQIFVKLIHSEESSYLLENHPNAFLLLTLIAKRARRYSGHPDGLNIGDAYIGDHNACGITRRQYRTALDVLIMRFHIKKIETCRTRQKSTTGTTTVGTLINLCSSTVYDINPEDADHRNDHRPATDRPRTRKNKKEQENNTTPTPSKEIVADDDVVVVSFYDFIDELQITYEDKVTLMKFPEERLKLALEFIKKQKNPRESIMGSIIWHCKQKNPPVNSAMSVQSDQQKLALTYNKFLKENGHAEIAETNIDLILSKNRVKCYLNGQFMPVGLDDTITDLQRTFRQSAEELQYARR